MILERLWVHLSLACLFCGALLQVFILRVLVVVRPSAAQKWLLKLGEMCTMAQNPRFRFEDWAPTFTSFASIRAIGAHLWLSLGQEAFVGGEAPDSPVVTLEGNRSSILKHVNGEATQTVRELVRDYSDAADFLVVYVAEAHSTDGWAFSNNVDIKQHQTLGDRLSAAQVLVNLEPRCPVVVDEMSNVTASKYGALPERLYVLQAGKVVYKGIIGPWGYDPSEVRSFLEKMK
ncbi:unnamed protein product [Merluccius merluccius]